MNTQMTKQAKPFSIAPKNLEEAMAYAKMISDSTLCPPNFKGKPGDVIIAMQMGSEIGLAPLQALQNIAVINGRPCVWGDAAIAICRSHQSCEYIKEWVEGGIKDGSAIAYCEAKRKGEEPQVRKFSIENATRANLWEKAGTWKQYPERMLQLRARGFALRDVFPDALRGLNIAEEIRDLPPTEYKDITPVTDKTKGMDKLKSVLGIAQTNVVSETGEVIECSQTEASDLSTIYFKIDSARNEDELAEVVELVSKLPEDQKTEVRKVYKVKKESFVNKASGV